MRKFLITLLIILAIAAVGASIRVLFFASEEPVSKTLYDAIPPDAGLIVDIRDYSELCRSLHENDLWNVLIEIPSIGTFNKDMMLLDSLVQGYEQAATFRDNIAFSFHSVENEKIQSIGYVKVATDKEVRNLIDLLKGFNFSCAYRGGIFIFSRSSILLENAMRQIVADNNITSHGNLAELMRSAGKNTPANIYINYNQLPQTALTIFHARHSKLIEPLARFANWTELDLNIKPDVLLLNGFTECSGNFDQWSETLLSQPAMPTELTDAMPSTTCAFLWMGIRRVEQYFADYDRYLDQHKEAARKKELNRLKTTFRIDVQKDFSERFEDELALVYANVGQTQSKGEPFVLFRIKSASSAIDMMEEWQSACRRNNVYGIDKRVLAIDYQLTFSAYRFPFDLPGTLFGDIFAGNNQWCVVADNYLVFGNSPENLQKYLHYTALHATFQTDVNYGKLTNFFSSRSNLMYFCHPALSDGIFDNVLKDNKYKELQQAIGALSQMQAVVYQINNTGGKLYNNLFLKYSSAEAPVAAGTRTSWESLLDAPISFKPQLAQNHSTGETDIFVQDMLNNTYLLNSVGRILWKVQLPEPIISQVYQIDFYRNGKLQMLFNTKNYIYVMDRLGNFVDKYPIKLKSPAVGGVALFDYDNNKQYRMMIACEDRKVYLYDKTTKPVEGWSFRQSEHPVQTDIYHFRAENKDFIVFADKYRVYILDRQGRTRVTPESNLPVSRQTMIALDKQRSRLTLTDTVGTVHFISLANGKMTQQKIKTFPSSHIFVFQDVDGDGQGDFIFASGNKLEVFRQDGKQILSMETEESITMRPYVYNFGANDLRIGVVQPQNNRIWLYDYKGKVCKGFPLRGSTLFSIARMDRSTSGFNLFVGSSNNFLYNYAVHK